MSKTIEYICDNNNRMLHAHSVFTIARSFHMFAGRDEENDTLSSVRGKKGKTMK